MSLTHDIIIIGAGPTGLTAALAAAQSGFSVALVDGQDIYAPRDDHRASTLAASSVAMMNALGIMSRIKDDAQPVHDMMIGEGRVGDISPLSLHFNGQSRDTPMAHVVFNEVLRQALIVAAKADSAIDIFNMASVTTHSRNSQDVHVSLENGKSLRASVLVACDGRNSALRKSAEIAVTRHDYAQKSITLTVSHTRPHHGVAHQLFLSGGPFAILPLPRDHASIVWTDSARAVDAAMALPKDALHAELARRVGDVLGQLTITDAPKAYPLSLQMAERYTDHRLVLMGDAARVIHPLAGQGLNLGLRDVATWAHEIAQARTAGHDIGTAPQTDYERRRRIDSTGLATATDALNTLFSNTVAPLRHLRRLGLAGVDNLPALRALLMAEAAGETGALPVLLQR